MALTLRRSRLDRPAAFEHLGDWEVWEDGQEIGRIYEVPAANDAALACFWAFNLMGPARGHVKTHGNAPTFEAAKIDFKRWLEAFRVWKPPG
jgi:hypothetical protein